MKRISVVFKTFRGLKNTGNYKATKSFDPLIDGSKGAATLCGCHFALDWDSTYIPKQTKQLILRRLGGNFSDLVNFNGITVLY